MHAVDPELVAQLPQLTVMDMVEKLTTLDGPQPEWVTLSGGNPALFDLSELVDELHIQNYKVAVETQGTVYKPWLQWCDLVTVSPKPPSSGNVTGPYTLQRFMAPFPPEGSSPGYPRVHVALKVVVFDDHDFTYARDILNPYVDYDRWVQVGNPEVDPCKPPSTSMLIERLGWLSNKCLMDPEMWGVRVTPQLHTLIWGNARGH